MIGRCTGSAFRPRQDAGAEAPRPRPAKPARSSSPAPRLHAPIMRGIRLRAQPRVMEAPPQPKALLEEVVIPMSERVTIMELRANPRAAGPWAIRTPEFRYCGGDAPIGEGPYCSTTRVAYQPAAGSPSRQGALTGAVGDRDVPFDAVGQARSPGTGIVTENDGEFARFGSDFEPPVVARDDVFDERESQPRAALRGSGNDVYAIEAPRSGGQVFGGDARPLVAHHDTAHAVLLVDNHRRPALSARRTDRILDQILRRRAAIRRDRRSR